MNQIIAFLAKIGAMLHPWMSEIATALVACAIVIFATDINRILRKSLAGSGFFVRTSAFVMINAFGYGLAIVSISPWLAGQLRSMPSQWMLLLVVGIFFAIGAWAQRNRQV
ncbi:hypothetical protein A9267_11060 [Shewanella sp. UCD-FRSSP16_17]|uniref:DUF3392 domain-containing protein n=1 Tax=Shewanella sp. UCD-FRSSP16_17 TaxID=1853256 RepID=UPI0007EEE403|nr:DUF3392 domain-containing protein [Shewanella sp. UCD-FRSSP16_17]OBT08246.1 hypothetical protein A9267_11060 [Shewanella sp. UCD-FRSSP16_17]